MWKANFTQRRSANPLNMLCGVGQSKTVDETEFCRHLIDPVLSVTNSGVCMVYLWLQITLAKEEVCVGIRCVHSK